MNGRRIFEIFVAELAWLRYDSFRINDLDLIMTQPHSAQIIPFPARAAGPAAEPAPPSAPSERLANALAALDAALARQKQAVADWRGAVGNLQSSIGKLGGSLNAYRETLGTVGIHFAQLNAEARKLEQLTDTTFRGS